MYLFLTQTDWSVTNKLIIFLSKTFCYYPLGFPTCTTHKFLVTVHWFSEVFLFYLPKRNNSGFADASRNDLAWIMQHGNACGINIFTQQFNFISEFSKTKQNIKKLLRPLDTEISLNATQKTSDEDTSKQIFWYIGACLQHLQISMQ